MGLISNLAKFATLSALGAFMIGGATYALFTSSTPTIAKAFDAGTVKIDEPFGFHWCGETHFKNLEPGDHGVGSIFFKNTVSLDEWVSLNTLLKGGSKDIFASFLNDNHPLRIGYTVQLINQFGLPIYQEKALGDYQTDYKPVLYFVNGCGCSRLTESKNPQSSVFFLPTKDAALVTFIWRFPLAAANDYQGASGTLTLNAQAIQASNNIVYKQGMGISPLVPPSTGNLNMN